MLLLVDFEDNSTACPSTSIHPSHDYSYLLLLTRHRCQVNKGYDISLLHTVGPSLIIYCVVVVVMVGSPQAIWRITVTK